ncbi:acyl carrier protein [Thermosporothrix hazakensis]|uniref:acyl carrier protein n=1 Tax=Thermosporothrix hazakensis TaxID=644383 RepID=UPI0031FD30EF
MGSSRNKLSSDPPLTQLGLESISALQLQSLIWQEFGVQLPLLFFLGETTLQTLVERVAQEQRVHQVATLLTADPEQRYEPFPLTEIQQAYWVGRQRALSLATRQPDYLDVIFIISVYR